MAKPRLELPDQGKDAVSHGATAQRRRGTHDGAHLSTVARWHSPDGCLTLLAQSSEPTPAECRRAPLDGLKLVEKVLK